MKSTVRILSLFIFLPAIVHSASMGRNAVTVEERVTGSDRVCVGRVRSGAARWQTNSYGDRLIVTRFTIDVEETFKGNTDSQVDLDVEGGTIGEVSLKVSDLPLMQPGMRGVFFLKEQPDRSMRPHLRGLGILPLDPSNVVEKSSLSLSEVRRIANEVQSRHP